MSLTPVQVAAPGTQRAQRYSALVALVTLTVFFNLAFPKAGFYVKGVPFTLGYGLLAVSAVAALLSVRRGIVRLGRPVLIASGLLLAFGVFSGVSVLLVGRATGVVDVITFFVSALLVPLLALVVGSAFVQAVPLRAQFRVLLVSAIVVSVFGLLSFAAINLTRHNVGIPFITVTGPHLDAIFLKNNDRGGLMKMVSTYNNGNILGVNLLLWLPLLVGLAGSWRPLWLLRPLLLFTLSRTVWIGWLVFEGLAPFLRQRFKPAVIAAALSVLVAAAGCVLITRAFSGNASGFLFDPTLGQRAGQVTSLIPAVKVAPAVTSKAPGAASAQVNPAGATASGSAKAAPVRSSVLWPRAFSGIREIVYASILRNFGLVGLLLFIFAWAYPLVAASGGPLTSWARLGLGLYLLLMLSDGAFALVPTQFVYWFAAAMALTPSSSRPQPTARAGVLNAR